MSSIKIKGIDVSRFQSNIDWSKVKTDGIEFAIIKATQGKDKKYPDGFIDSCFEKHYKGAKATGLKVGAYHFAVFTTEAQAKEEAQYFLSAIKGKTFEYPLCLDLEDISDGKDGRSPILSHVLSKKQLTDYSIVFMEEVKKAGYRVMLYTSMDWRKNKLDYSRLGDYLLWQAQYPWGYTYKEMEFFYNNRPATVDNKVSIWQCTSVGKVNGITNSKGELANVDMNWAFADLSVPGANIPSTSAAPSVSSTPKIGDPLGKVLYTDIRAYINGHAIPVSVANSKTLVIAEDLEYYGFDIEPWDKVKSELRIERNKNKAFAPLKVEQLPIGTKSGDIKCDYVFTDIKTYLSNQLVESYCIDGRTLIDVELLARYGSKKWDEPTKVLRLTLA